MKTKGELILVLIIVIYILVIIFEILYFKDTKGYYYMWLIPSLLILYLSTKNEKLNKWLNTKIKK